MRILVDQQEIKDIREAALGVGRLIVVIDATHGGFVNRNHVFYPTGGMAKMFHTWTTNFNKPVLIYHNLEDDPIGRVASARYIDQGPAASDSTNSNLPTGYIELTCEITSRDAIEKVLDGRYSTVSVSGRPGIVACSICDHDIREGLCEHTKGKTYEDEKGTRKLCFWVMDDIEYSEVSFVNKPADVFAKVVAVRRPALSYFTVATDGTSALPFTFTDEENEHMDNKDKELNAASRKRLPDSAFCGPARSYPAHDKAHAVNALARVKQHGSPALQARVKACVCRKFSDLPTCKGDSKDWENIDPATAWPKELLDELQKIRDVEWDIGYTLDELLETPAIKTYIADLAKQHEAEIALLKSSSPDLEKKAKDLQTEADSLKSKVASLEQENAKLASDIADMRAKSHRALADRLYELQMKLSKPAVKSLDKDEAVQAYKETLCKRSDDSLNDAIADLVQEQTVAQVPKTKVGPTEDGTTQIASDSMSREEKRKENIKKVLYPENK